MKDNYKKKIIEEILSAMESDEYYQARLKGDNTKSINIDREGLELLRNLYDGKIKRGMRDNPEGYSTWKALSIYKDELAAAIESKDEGLVASAIFDLLWTVCNEHDHSRVFAGGDGEFLFDTEERANTLADLMDLAGLCGKTGYYDPEEDERKGCVDRFTGKWYAGWE